MKTILVTGSTGFLGKHLIEQLKDAEPEARLRLLCRNGTPFQGDPQCEIVQGDITSPEEVSRAAAGANEVYHLAGIVDRDPRMHWRLYQTHVGGTRNVCEAMMEHGVEKAVMVSSSGTVAVGHEPIERDETWGYANDVVAEWPYYLSKIFAEKAALWYASHHKLPITVVNPSLLLGPGDERQSSTGDVALYLGGQIKVIPSGGLNLVDVRDAAAGLIAAMRRGRPGERYLLGGPNWTFREWIHRVARLSGIRPPSVEPPVGLSVFGGRLLRRLMPLVGKEFKLDEPSIKMSALFWYCDSTKARQELGFTTRDPLETLRETIDDIRQRNPHLRN
jgi:dihydroflavonol-4-reductase